jgi:hypothetical protein
MSGFDVLRRFGTAALLRFLATVALFVLLHLVRIPFYLLARALEVGMRRVDASLTSSLSSAAASPRPHTDFFATSPAA